MIQIPDHVQKMIWQATGISPDQQARSAKPYYFFQQHQMEHFVRLMEEHYAQSSKSGS
jgi:hypothetical protein